MIILPISGMMGRLSPCIITILNAQGWPLANFAQISQLVTLQKNAPFFVIFNMQRFLMRVTVGKDHTCKMVIMLLIIFYVKVLRDF